MLVYRDVRKAALSHIPQTSTTLPLILLRTRDTDTNIRKLVYASILSSSCVPDTLYDSSWVGHPRSLTIAQRELVVKNGLGDREALVKNACEGLIGGWVDVVREKENDAGANKGEVVEDVIAFLKLFDLADPESKIGEDALLSVFKTRVDIFDALEFGDAYWASLTPERAFLARVFVSHCINTKDNTRLEDALPVVTALAFRIQGAYNALLEDMHSSGGDEDEEKEDERLDRVSVIGEMLRLAVDLDYADEIGRRKMFQLVRKS